MWTTEIQILMKRSSLNFSLRKQPTFGDATTGFPAMLFKFVFPQFTSFSFKKHFWRFLMSVNEVFLYHRLRVFFTPSPFFPMVRPVQPKCSLCTDSPSEKGPSPVFSEERGFCTQINKNAFLLCTFHVPYLTYLLENCSFKGTIWEGPSVRYFRHVMLLALWKMAAVEIVDRRVLQCVLMLKGAPTYNTFM